MEQVKILLLAIGIFMMFYGGSIAAVHASIIGDFGIGYQAGKDQAYSDWNGGYSQNDSCPSGNSISYCSGYTVGYDAEWGTLQQAQP
jgi:hypothetical protein